MTSRDVTVNLIGNNRLSREADAAGKSVSKLRGAVMGIGGAIAGAFALDQVVAFTQGAIQEARESVKVTKMTAAVIKSTGGAAKISAKQVGDLAESLSTKVGVDDEAIQTGANLLLTFKNVRNEAGAGSKIFDRATAAIVDMTAGMNQGEVTASGLKSSTIQLGKALNDPIKGMSSLSKVGIQFTADQKKRIEGFVQEGNILGAQKIILKEVESQFKGTAAAAADPMKRAQIAWDNFRESIGMLLLPVLDKTAILLTTKIIPAANAFGRAVTGDFKGVAIAVGIGITAWLAYITVVKTATGVSMAAAAVSRVASFMSSAWDTMRLKAMMANDAVAQGTGRLRAYTREFNPAKSAMGGFKSAIGGVSGALGGPWGIALTAGIALVTAFAAQHEASKRKIQEVTDALKADSGAIGENTRQLITNRLEKEGAFAAAQRLGISLRLVGSAAAGDTTALGQLNQQLNQHTRQITVASYATGGQSQRMTVLTNDAQKLQGSIVGLSGDINHGTASLQRGAQAQQGMKMSLDGTSIAVNNSTVKLKANNAALAENARRFASDEQQMVDFKLQITQATAAITKNSHAFFGNSQKALENRAKLLSLASGVQSHIDKLQQEGRWTVNTTGKMIYQKARLVELAQKYGLSRVEAEKYINKIIKIPRDPNLTSQRAKLIEVAKKFGLSTKEAQRYVGQLMKIPKKRNTDITVDAKGRFSMVKNPGTFREFHMAGGGLVRGSGGPRSDTVAARLSPGEFVVNANATKRFLPQLAAINDDGNRGSSYRGQGYHVSGRHGLDVGDPRFAGGGLVHKYNRSSSAPGAISAATKGTRTGMDEQGRFALRETVKAATKILKMIGGPGIGPALRWAKTQAGKPYIWGGVGPRGYDCSGFMSAIVNRIKGKPIHRRLFTTHSFNGRTGPGGFVRNMPSGFRVGVTNAGVGHMAGTLGGVNVESSGSAGVRVGGGARGATNGLFGARYGLRADTGNLALNPGWNPPVYNGTGKAELLEVAANSSGGTYNINVSVAPGGNPAEVGRQIVSSIKEYERRSGKGWRS